MLCGEYREALDAAAWWADLGAMKALLNLSRYHWIVVFLAAGVFAIGLAYTSYNLFHLSMANFSFIRRFGWTAIMEGAFVQTLQILVGGCFALFFFFAFKACELELLSRYKNWQDR